MQNHIHPISARHTQTYIAHATHSLLKQDDSMNITSSKALKNS